MLLPERHASDESYRYGFQGQEKDDELKGEDNSLNYKYRMHNPRIGRFFAIDPLVPKYPGDTPYQFSENRVIDMVKLEGLEPAEAGSKEGQQGGKHWDKEKVRTRNYDPIDLFTGKVRPNWIWHEGGLTTYQRYGASVDYGAPTGVTKKGWYPESEYLEIIRPIAEEYAKITHKWNIGFARNRKPYGDYSKCTDFVTSRDLESNYISFLSEYADGLANNHNRHIRFMASGAISQDDLSTVAIFLPALRSAYTSLGTSLSYSGTRVFYNGTNAKSAATSFAELNGYRTLDMMWYGRLGNALKPYLSKANNDQMWVAFSRIFARNANGGRVLIQGTYKGSGVLMSNIKSQSYWKLHEFSQFKIKSFEVRAAESFFLNIQ